MSKFYKVLLWITTVAAVVYLSMFIWTVVDAGRHAVASKAWQQTLEEELQALNQAPAGKAQTTPSLTADQKIALEQSVAQTRALLITEIHAADADERAILDRLITLVGVFSAILGLCAFATVKLAREDALAQHKRIETDLESFKTTTRTELGAFKTNTETELKTFQTTSTSDTTSALNKTRLELETFKTDAKNELLTFTNKTTADMAAFQATTSASLQNLQDTTKQLLDALTRKTETQIEEFRKQIWSELPEMRNLKDSLRNLMLELERTIPNVADWNEAAAYENLSAATKESILIAESTINALQIFVSRDSQANAAAQAGLYRSLARFYFGKFRAGGVDEDAQRADIYARKAGELEPNNPATDRVRGSIYLGRYRIVKKAAGLTPAKKDMERMEALLTAATGFLKDAMTKDENDAGAALNLALAARYRDDFDEAIRISYDAIGNRDKMNSLQVQKYLPSLYLNVACYLARRADKQVDVAAQDNGRKEAVQALRDGMGYLDSRKNPRAVAELRDMISRELQRQDALKNLGKDNLDAVEALAMVKVPGHPNATTT